MFYRYTKSGARIPVDMDGLYENESVFLLGGSPKLRELPLELLRKPGIVTLAVNNVPCYFERPNLWVCADKPHCFSPHIYSDPAITKFTMISRREIEVPGTGTKIRQFPNMYFFGAREGFNFRNFLDPHRDLVWWRSVFPIALQLAFRLGFRTVYLAGCSFNMNKSPGQQYAWKTNLTADQAQYSHNTYNRDLARLVELKPTFDRKSFDLVSCTPDSRAHGTLSYLPLEKAVERVLASKPNPANTETLLHSSELKNMPAKKEAVGAA